MQVYPVTLTLAGRDCLVTGDGARALKRIKSLQNCGARVTHATDNHSSMNDAVKFIPFCESDAPAALELENYWLVIAASKDSKMNASIVAECEKIKKLCYNEDDPSSSSFILPAVVDRSPLVIAITTGGKAPALARAVKSRLESLIPAAYARFACIIGQHQAKVKNTIPHKAARSGFWHSLLHGPVADRALNLDESRLEALLVSELSQYESSNNKNIVGTVSLVGAGPGDPDLLTFRALRLIQSADVLVYDRLVSETILDLRRPDSELIYAGKEMANHSMPQQSINQLLVDLALEGKYVVRLKGGDPFIFGRGGEEIQTLSDQGVPFQVVPGITAASGCAAFSGIPLTHRDYAQSCTFVTGHLRDGTINLQWNTLCDDDQTVVVYMGLTGLGQICIKLIEAGRDANTPAALVQQGTTPNQQVYTGTLQTLPTIVDKNEVRAPTLLIIGHVVSLRDKLNWYDAISS